MRISDLALSGWSRDKIKYMGFINFPGGREFFSLFWNGVISGIKEMVTSATDALRWILETLSQWFS
jgi:hypothetical protein